MEFSSLQEPSALAHLLLPSSSVPPDALPPVLLLLLQCFRQILYLSLKYFRSSPPLQSDILVHAFDGVDRRWRTVFNAGVQPTHTP